MLQLALDIMMMLLLIATIWFCRRLNLKIGMLKDSKQHLLKLIEGLDSALIKTHKNITELKAMSSNSTVELQICINKATELIADLSFMVDNAEKLANRLESSLINGKKQETFKVQPLVANNDDQAKIEAPPSTSKFVKARQELLSALQKMKNKE